MTSSSVGSILAASSWAGICLWLFLARPRIFWTFVIFLFAFSFRILDTLYIDTVGPVKAQELFRDIGPGASTIPLVLAYVVVLLPMVALLTPSKRRDINYHLAASMHRGPGLTIRDWAFISVTVYLILLWGDFIRIGIVPAFAGMERYVYTREYGGYFHRLLMEWGNILAMALGFLFAARRRVDNRVDQRFLGALLVVLIYLFLAGHRFSAFYSYSAFFLMGAGVTDLGSESRRSASDSTVKLKYVLLAVMLLGLVGFALLRSYTVVRGGANEEAVQQALKERVLVQQGEMWWATYERVFKYGQTAPEGTIDFLFLSPTDPDRNSTIQYLMFQVLPEQRVREILREGSNYAGGFPEIHFELFGPWLGYLSLLLYATLYAFALRWLSRAAARRRYGTVVFMAVALYPPTIHFLGGMLNFLTAWTFWLKIAVATMVAVAEAATNASQNRKSPRARETTRRAPLATGRARLGA